MSGTDQPSDSDGHDETEPEESASDKRQLERRLVVAVHIGDFADYAQDLGGWVIDVVTTII